jgi:hypothetical protein
MKKPVASLTTSVRGVVNDPSYTEMLEDSIHQLARKYKGVRAGPSSAFAAEGFPETQTETITLIISNESAVERVADAIIVAIRTVGIQKGLTITLSKQVTEQGEEVVYEKPILPEGDTQWALPPTANPGENPGDEQLTFPERIQYLESYGRRYYLVGGNDVTGLFRRPSVLRQFISSLPKSEAVELREIYQKIVSCNDHRWLVSWVNEDNEDSQNNPCPRAMALHLLAFLDRLREGGLLDDLPDADHVELVDWNLLAG